MCDLLPLRPMRVHRKLDAILEWPAYMDSHCGLNTSKQHEKLSPLWPKLKILTRDKSLESMGQGITGK